MRPSERINQILEEMCKEKRCAIDSEWANMYGYQERAIIMFLDEKYEQLLSKKAKK